MFESANLAPRFVLSQFFGLSGGKQAGKEDAIEAACRWAAGDPITYAYFGLTDPGGFDDYPRQSLVLRGRPGVGKTALASAAFRARLEREGVGLYIEFYDLMNAIQAGYSSDTDESSKLLKAAQDAPILMLDDLGDPDRLRFAESDDKRIKLYNIINHRVALELPTIITTNLAAEDMADQFGQRITERVQEMAVWITVGGVKLRPGVVDDFAVEA